MRTDFLAIEAFTNVDEVRTKRAEEFKLLPLPSFHGLQRLRQRLSPRPPRWSGPLGLPAAADMIRHASPDDAQAIAILYHDTVKKINSRDYGPAQIKAWAGERPNEEKWRARRTNRTTFVDEDNGPIRGFAELEDNGHIAAVYVHADCQGGCA